MDVRSSERGIALDEACAAAAAVALAPLETGCGDELVRGAHWRSLPFRSALSAVRSDKACMSAADVGGLDSNLLRLRSESCGRLT